MDNMDDVGAALDQIAKYMKNVFKKNLHRHITAERWKLE